MDIEILKCGHCDTNNYVDICKNCSRPFMVVENHFQGELREFDDPPLESVPTQNFVT